MYYKIKMFVVGIAMTVKMDYIEFEEVEELSNSERGEGGFGSSGR